MKNIIKVCLLALPLSLAACGGGTITGNEVTLPIPNPNTSGTTETACAANTGDSAALSTSAALTNCCNNGTDDDKDGLTDCADSDCTGQTDCEAPVSDDVDQDGFNISSGDCDDANAAVYPGATETANGIDDDCDGVIDETNPVVSETVCDDNLDDDSDEVIDCLDSDCAGVSRCFDGDNDGFMAFEDCDDTTAAVSPASTEILTNGIDDDCDGVIDDPSTDVDADHDGYRAPRDCNDNDATIHPGAREVANDGIDQDCNGRDRIDVDGDHSPAGRDCNDADATIHPGATDIANDGIDQDCDGHDRITITPAPLEQDLDGDGYKTGIHVITNKDCNDNDATIHPGATEVRNDGIDQDCNGSDATGTGPTITPGPIHTGPIATITPSEEDKSYDSFKPFFMARGFNTNFDSASSLQIFKFGGTLAGDLKTTAMSAGAAYTGYNQTYAMVDSAKYEDPCQGANEYSAGCGYSYAKTKYKFSNYFVAGAADASLLIACPVNVIGTDIDAEATRRFSAKNTCFNGGTYDLSAFDGFETVISSLQISHTGGVTTSYAELKNLKFVVSYDSETKEIIVESNAEGIDKENYGYNATISLVGYKKSKVDHVEVTPGASDFDWNGTDSTFERIKTFTKGTDFDNSPENESDVILGMSGLSYTWDDSNVTNYPHGASSNGNVRFNDACPSDTPEFILGTVSPDEDTWNTAKIKGINSHTWASSVTPDKVEITVHGSIWTTHDYGCVKNVNNTINVSTDSKNASMHRAPTNLRFHVFILDGHDNAQAVQANQSTSDYQSSTEIKDLCQTTLAANMSTVVDGTKESDCSIDSFTGGKAELQLEASPANLGTFELGR